VNRYDIDGIAFAVTRAVRLPAVKRPAKTIVPSERIEHAIDLIRSEKVMLGHDLVSLYGVTTAALVQAVKRNPGRFPEDFMFQLSDAEFANLKSQIVTSSWGGHRKNPYASAEIRSVPESP